MSLIRLWQSWLMVWGVALVVGACALQPTQPPIVVPTAATRLTLPQLKYVLMDSFGGMGPEGYTLHYCDDDVFPIGHGSIEAKAVAALPQIEQQPDVWQAIVERLGLPDQAALTPEQIIAIYQQSKQLEALPLDPQTEPYVFQVAARRPEGDFQFTGTIDAYGQIHIQTTTPVPGSLICPICLAAETLIDTPLGALPVEALRPGVLIWTQDQTGQRIAAPIQATRQAPIHQQHRFIRLVLADGRAVEASPHHPLSDGRLFAALQVGDRVDQSRIVQIETRLVDQGASYDLLAEAGTGVYWANGVLLKSTIPPGPLH